MTFEELCKRWKISPYSSNSVYYDVFRKEQFMNGLRKKPYKIDTARVYAYEKRIGFAVGMITISEYMKKYNVSKYLANKFIERKQVDGCNLCSSTVKSYYRMKDAPPKMM